MSDAMLAETIHLTGWNGDRIEAYLARPLSPQPRGGVVVIHHMPGWSFGMKEITRRFAAEGYLALCPNLHYRDAPGASPDDASAASRANGGVPDERLLGDVGAAVEFLRLARSSNGRVGVIGYCSGGRQAFLAGCNLPVDAAVDCYGAFVNGIPPADFPIPVTPIMDQADRLSCPLLGLFGGQDRFPSPEHVAELDEVLTRLGKEHEFHSYPEAGHGFFSPDRPSYRQAAAVDGWARILTFFGRTLS